jgi:hypothetical protein
MLEQEFVGHFLDVVFEAPLAAAEVCLAALPEGARPYLLKHLTACAEHGHYYSGLCHIRGWLDLGLDIAQQEQGLQQMQPHYRVVGERLLALLRAKTRPDETTS